MALIYALLMFIGMPNTSKAADLFNNTNRAQVNNCQQPVVNCSPRFLLSAPATIDEIQTYHRAGAAPAGKSIGLRDASGSMVAGPFPVTTQPASPGFENWIASVGGQQLPAGTYTVIDSQADMWSQNARSCDGPGVVGAACNKGFAIVRGGNPPVPPPGADASITDCSATCTVPPATTSPPAFACSAHGPKSTCKRAAASADNPGGGVMCTDGKNVTTCNCQTGCTTH
ncbi:hypothetical protein [Dyella tabacisoli]|uniref:hypothetical protein n=1 Tax=Dyella tabacisoli TaxID=2282381 RepID=UPI0013B40E74|nr:hypothetical protein [Dyella tabacisoli]